MRAAILIAALALCGGVAPAWAETGPELEAEAAGAAPDAAEEPGGVVPLGSSTKAWMDRQRSGAVASPHPSGLSPPEDYRSRIRHLDSFSHPIPPFFERESFAEGGS